MKKIIMVFFIGCLLNCFTVQKASSQSITQIIKDAIVKVIKAVDLKIQRLQTQTIWLQNAQKVVENTMSQLRLNEITDWVQKQKDLYGEYYNELWQVKSVVMYYHRIKEITQMQVQLVAEYKHAWNLLRQDNRFTPDEINYMEQVYEGILSATVQDIDALSMVINAFTTQMSDADRMQVINTTAAQTQQHYDDLKQFNTENELLSLSRAKDENEIALIKAMYGLE